MHTHTYVYIYVYVHIHTCIHMYETGCTAGLHRTHTQAESLPRAGRPPKEAQTATVDMCIHIYIYIYIYI